MTPTLPARFPPATHIADTYDAPDMSTRYHVAIRRLDDDAVLVLADAAMPGFRLEDAPWWQVVTPVVDRMHADHGLRVEVLRAAWLADPVPGADAPDRLYEAVVTGGRLPPGARWVALADLERRPTPLGRAIDGGVLEPSAGDLQPWYRPGWLAEMDAWIDTRITELGLRRHGPVRQVRSWGRSALLRLETDRGGLWAKQVPMAFAHEVAVTGLLADIDPGIVPPVVAADAAAGRLLLEHVEGPILADLTGATEPWAATMARFAELQRVLAGDTAALRMAGVPSAPLEVLAGAVPALIADPGRAMVGAPGGLTPEDHEALVRATDDLVAACRALAETDVPASLDHGDLSPGQVLVSEMGPVILDWSDATITHPFLAAASFLAEPATLPGTGGHLPGSAYVAGWGGGAEAQRALELAHVVFPLHLAKLYRERVLPGLEQPWEMERMIPWALRTLLPRLHELPRILRG